MLKAKGIMSLGTVPILNGTLVMSHLLRKQEDMMAVNAIIVLLVGFIAVLAVMAWMLDNWRNDNEDDDFEPYG